MELSDEYPLVQKTELQRIECKWHEMVVWRRDKYQTYTDKEFCEEMLGDKSNFKQNKVRGHHLFFADTLDEGKAAQVVTRADRVGGV